MVVAEAELSGTDGIASRKHFGALGRRTLVGTAQAAQREIDPFARGLALNRGKALGDHELVRNAQKRVEQPGAACVGIFLDPEQAGEAAAARATHLDRVEPEADA